MSHFNFKVKDYRIIQSADVSPEGITLLFGKNGSGKSTLIKSLVTLLSNKHSEDNFTHGKDSYSISATAGENTITYSRSGSNAQVQFNNETPKTKLGKGFLYELEPRFPLKRYDFEDSDCFYPNFIFQNSTVFDEIDPSQLFSIMFSDIGNISGRVSQLKKEVTNTSKLKNDLQVGSDVLKGKVSEASKVVDRIKSENPDLEERYKFLSVLAVKRDNYTKFMVEYSALSAQCGDPVKRSLVSLYDEAQPLFSDLVFVNNVKSTLSQLDKTNSELNTCKFNLQVLTDTFPVNVVSLVSGVKQIVTCQSSLESVHRSVEALPDISFGLVTSVPTVITLIKTLEDVQFKINKLPDVSCTLVSEVSELLKLKNEYTHVVSQLEVVNNSYDSVMKQLKDFPCDRLVNGLCPYQEQIKVGV